LHLVDILTVLGTRSPAGAGIRDRPHEIIPPIKFATVFERRSVRWGLELLLLLGVVDLVVYRTATFVSQPQQRRGRFQNSGNQPVGVARIHRGDIHLTLNALGAVTPLTTVTVTTQISGLLMSVGFKEGPTRPQGRSSWRKSIRDPTRWRSNRIGRGSHAMTPH
jgi:hypothetical protein